MGHEIACHGYSHQVIYNQTPKTFQEDVTRAKAILEDITGQRVIGYRAPTYSITRKTIWALDILEELGFRYDSSIFPIHHDNYGIPGSPRHPYQHQGMNLVEFPISTLAAGPVNLPMSGGGYFRLLPYDLTKFALKRLQNRDRPFIFYLHPWEFNPDEPRPHKLPPLSAFRTYIGLKKTAARFSRLVDDFEFSTVPEVLKTMGMLK
jgi:polysaccharide deacetylase family protein (PEP-CTERM system associated)